jgi:uncharacterized protein YecE (DUF72 family)
MRFFSGMNNRKPEWLIGCSGFHYPEWKEIFYPEKLPKSKWFEFYCEVFRTLEINGTFYRYPKEETLSSWYQRSPRNFTFSVKVPRTVTHFRRMRNVREPLARFYEIISRGLRDKIGCVLFQLHASLEFTTENLDQILGAVDSGFDNVLEFRHKSWWNPVVFESLQKEKITFCGISHPSLPDTVRNTPNLGYYRFHGTPTLYRSSYSRQAIKRVYASICEQPPRRMYIYFNNTANGAAIDNAIKLMRMVAGRLPAKV